MKCISYWECKLFSAAHYVFTITGNTNKLIFICKSKPPMKVIIASDHAGLDYKNILLKDIRQQGYEVTDIGTFSKEPDDYPDRAADVANAIINEKGERGIIICGSGVGASVAANKLRGVRATLCGDTYSAHQSREHDDCNVLCLGARVTGVELASEIAHAFVGARFTGEERHRRRLEKVAEIDRMKDATNPP